MSGRRSQQVIVISNFLMSHSHVRIQPNTVITTVHTTNMAVGSAHSCHASVLALGNYSRRYNIRCKWESWMHFTAAVE